VSNVLAECEEARRCDCMGPHQSAVPGDKASHRGEARTEACELVFRMKTLKRTEQSMNFAGIECRTVVAQAERSRLRLSAR
jgi:hypothetical protein